LRIIVPFSVLHRHRGWEPSLRTALVVSGA
jgi:hypothetical protein